jgi:hypothetical protein
LDSTSITMNNSGKIFKMLLLISFALAGCQAAPTTPSPQPTATRTAAPATATLTPTPKKKVTITLRVTLTSTKTRTPTLSSEQIGTQVSEYLTDNGGCKLPCWWGIVPGETSWETAENILAPIASDRFGWKTGKDFGAAFYFQYIPNPDLPDYYDLSLDLQIRDNVVTQIGINYFGSLAKYDISQLLKDYGKPDEVRVVAANTGNDPRFTTYNGVGMFVLYYDQGFMAYYGIYGTKSNDIIQACFQESGYLDLWHPGDANTLLEYGKLFDTVTAENLDFIRPIEDVTVMNMDGFYQIFTSRENPCLWIDQRNWPTPNP